MGTAIMPLGRPRGTQRGGSARAMILVALCALCALSTLNPIGAASPSTQPAGDRIVFDVLDRTRSFETAIAADLALHIRYQGGWIVEVVENGAGPDAPNLLYHSRTWHGPYPTQIQAWHEAARLFDHERVLPVRGHPYEVVISLTGIETRGQGSASEFVAGRVEVTWRSRGEPIVAATGDEERGSRYEEIRALIRKNLRWTVQLARVMDTGTIREVRRFLLPGDVTVLIRMLADSDGKVRAAASGLLATQGQRAVPALIEAFASEEEFVAQGATDALQVIERCQVEEGAFRDADLCPEE